MTHAESSSSAALDRLLGSERRPPWYRRAWLGWLALLLIGLAAGWWAWHQAQARQAAPVFVTEPLTRGNLTLTVTASGTLQPVRAVNIGSELSGTVKEVLVDEVSIGPAGSHTFSDLDRDHFVEVIFDTAPATEGGGGCSGGGIPGAAAVILLVPMVLAAGRKNKG